MYNDLFSIGSLTIHTYGLMTAIGIIAAYVLMEHRAEKKDLNKEWIFGLLIFCLIFGYLGSKLLYLVTILPELQNNPSLLRSSLSGGWVVYGGILGGILGGHIYCSWRKLPEWDYFDNGLEAMALAQGFGRIGCFFAGCCYGKETTSRFSIVFSHSVYAPNHVHLIPTQLISSAFDFVLCFLLLYFDNHRKKAPGEPTALYLILYSLGRFVIEGFRGDLERGAVGPLSTSQFISIFVFLFGVILLIRRRASAEKTGK